MIMIDPNIYADVWLRLEMIRLPFVKKVLDLGSCSCTLKDTYPYKGTHITFTDLKNSDGYIFQRVMEENKDDDRYSFVETPCYDLSPFDDNSFEMVTFSHVIEHLTTEEINKTMKEIKRVLIPNGLLIISTPNKPSRKLLGNYCAHPGHIEEFSTEDIIDIIDRHKFKEIVSEGVLKVRNQNGIPSVESGLFKDTISSYVLFFICGNIK